MTPAEILAAAQLLQLLISAGSNVATMIQQAHSGGPAVTAAQVATAAQTAAANLTKLATDIASAKALGK